MVTYFTNFTVRLDSALTLYSIWLVENCFCMYGCDHCKSFLVGLYSCWWRRGSPDLSAPDVEKQPGRNFGQWSCGNRSHEEITCQHHQPAEGKTRALDSMNLLLKGEAIVSHLRSLSSASKLCLFTSLLCCQFCTKLRSK